MVNQTYGGFSDGNNLHRFISLVVTVNGRLASSLSTTVNPCVCLTLMTDSAQFSIGGAVRRHQEPRPKVHGPE
jgi:hypothetical protein